MTDQSSDPSAAPSPPARPRGRRKLWIGLLVVIVLLVGFVLLLPTLVSTGPGTRLTLGLVSSPGRHIQAGSLSIGWFSGQSVKNLDVDLPQRGLSVKIDNLRAPDVGLLPMLLGSRDLGTVAAGTIRIQRTAATGPSAAGPAAGPGKAPASKPATVGMSFPGNLQLHFTAKKVEYQAPGAEPITLNNVDARIDTGDLQKIQLAVKSDIHQADEQGRVNVNATVRDAFSAAGREQWDQARIDARADVVNLPTALIDGLMNQRGRLTAMLGPRLNLALTAKGPVRQLRGRMRASSEYLKANLALTHEGGVLSATPRSSVTWTLTPAALEQLGGAALGGVKPGGVKPGGTAPSRVKLLKPVKIVLTLKRLKLPAKADGKGLDVSAGSIEATLTASDIALQVPRRGRLGVRALRMELKSSNLGRQIDAALTATAEAAGKSGPVKATVSIKNAMGPGLLDVRAAATALPIELIDAVANQNGRLVETLGPTMDASLNVTRQADRTFAFTADLQSPRLAGAVEGRCDPATHLMSLRTPRPLALILTPKAFAAWTAYATSGGAAAVTLVATTTARLNVKHLQVACRDAGPGKMQLDPARTRLNAVLSLGQAQLRDPASGRRMTVDGATVTIKTSDPQKQIDVQLDAKVGASPAVGDDQASAATSPGTIDSRTQVRNLVDEAGRINIENASIRSHDEIKAIPSVLIDTALHRGGQLADLLGPTTSATANLQYRPHQPGSAQLTIDSDHVKGDVDATISANNVVSLKKDARFKINVTPAVTEAMLRKINPMLGGVKAGSMPLALTIAHRGFSMPATGFDWSKVNAAANLQAGTLTIKPTGLAGVILGVLGQLSIVPNQSAYQVQLSPMNMQVNKGVLSYDQLKLGVDGAALDFKGEVNLVTQKLNLTMSIGGRNVGRTLAGMSLPITGTINKPKIKTGDLLKIGVQRGALEGLKKIGGKDVQKYLEGIDQLLGGPKNASQPTTQQQKRVNPLEQLLEQLRRKHDRKKQKNK